MECSRRLFHIKGEKIKIAAIVIPIKIQLKPARKSTKNPDAAISNPVPRSG